MKTIHIKGIANTIDICENLSDNYKLDVNFNFDELSIDTISNVFFRFYECPEPCSLEKAIENNIRKEFGTFQLEGQDYGYSEYTVEGFNITNATLGGHNLQQIISSKGDKYLHILIDKVN